MRTKELVSNYKSKRKYLQGSCNRNRRHNFHFQRVKDPRQAVTGSSVLSKMAGSGVETQTIENIELKVDDNPVEDRVDIDIKQVTEETTPLKLESDSDEFEFGFGRDEAVVITEQDIEGMSESSKEQSTEVSANLSKVYEEWIFVDVNKSTHEVKENLLILSSVYGNDQVCCTVM